VSQYRTTNQNFFESSITFCKSKTTIKMKLSLFCLLAGLCLVTANAVQSSSTEDEYEEMYDGIDELIANDLADDITDIESHVTVSWLGIFFIIQKALSAVKGVKCTVKEVVEIESAAQTFLNDVQACGEDNINSKAQKLIATCKNIVTNAGNIISINESVCSGTSTVTTNAENASIDAFTVNTKISCFFKLFGKTLKLKNQIRHAIYLISQIPKVTGQANECVNTAAADLGTVFYQFPTKVKYCSKLFS
ncbi:hypothetical protein DOY81_009234, partial [Sarcophaga bullata]